jgi:hypothetical protein
MARLSWAAELAPAMARAVASSNRGPGLSDTEVWLGAEKEEKGGFNHQTWGFYFEQVVI